MNKTHAFVKPEYLPPSYNKGSNSRL